MLRRKKRGNLKPDKSSLVVDLRSVLNSPILPEGHLVMVTAKLLFYEQNKFTGKNYINSKTLNPAVVVFCEATGN